MIFNQEQAEAALAKWQKILRLQDWEIKVKIVRQSLMPCLDIMAHVNCVYPSKQALIKLLDPIDYPRDTEWGQDHEQSLVHELLHLHCWGFSDEDPSSPKGICEDQMVAALATALVELKRS
jgi:hypothetical protein